jgi:uncharacterized membrane protein YphA (DoxX/SURF4 family)
MSPTFSKSAVLVARIVFAAVFLMAFVFKASGIQATAAEIAQAGFPIPLVLAVLAALLELALVICFLSGAFFTEAALAATVYVLFLGFSFHGPGRWAANQSEFSFFVDHFTFAAGLLIAAVHGPGELALRRFRLLRAA